MPKGKETSWRATFWMSAIASLVFTGLVIWLKILLGPLQPYESSSFIWGDFHGWPRWAVPGNDIPRFVCVFAGVFWMSIVLSRGFSRIEASETYGTDRSDGPVTARELAVFGLYVACAFAGLGMATGAMLYGWFYGLESAMEFTLLILCLLLSAQVGWFIGRQVKKFSSRLHRKTIST